MYVHVRDQIDKATYALTGWVPAVREDQEALPCVPLHPPQHWRPQAAELSRWMDEPKKWVFLGAMVDGVVEDADGDEGDALLTSSGSHKQSPYLASQRSHRKP